MLFRSVLSKPVQRHGFIAAKIGGILAALTVFVLIGGVAAYLSILAPLEGTDVDGRISGAYAGAFLLGCGAGGLANYISRLSFAMTAILAMCVTFPLALLVAKLLPVHSDQVIPPAGDFAAAVVLAWFAVLAMGALATALSTRLELVPNMLACSTVFLLGLVSDYIFGRAAATSSVAWLAHNLVPNWQLFWMADALAAGKAIPWAYVVLGAAYAATFILFFAVLAILLFRTREVGGNARR